MDDIRLTMDHTLEFISNAESCARRLEVELQAVIIQRNDLLAVCEAVVEMWGDHCFSPYVAVVEQARAAIAKARGESPTQEDR